MAIDLKYGRVTLEHGSIGEDEPVFVFRARDKMLPKVLSAYWRLCATGGSPQHHLDAIRRAINRILVWQSDNDVLIPSSDEDIARIKEEVGGNL